MPHCTYQTTNNNRGYSDVHVGSTKEAEKLYPKNMGLTLLRAVTSNNNSTAKDEVVFSVGPVSQEHGLRTENPSDPGVFRRNPLNTRRSRDDECAFVWCRHFGFLHGTPKLQR